MSSRKAHPEAALRHRAPRHALKIRNMKAEDIMTRKVICVRPGTTVEPIVRLLTAHRIGGIPTVTPLPVV